jgi:hypothetical protein
MDEPNTFALDGTDVTVSETADALVYTFTPRRSGPRPSFPLVIMFVFVVFPLGLLALVGYAYSKAANRVEWEDALTGVFVAQLLAWLVFGIGQFWLVLRWWWRPFGTVLKFTRKDVWHGNPRVCALDELRGVRLFVYPTAPVRLLADDPPPRTEAPPNPNVLPIPPELAPIAPEDRPAPPTEACLSLVISEDGGTHGLLGGFPDQPLRAFAEDLHRRLAAFRFNQGIMAQLDALSVVETTEAEAPKLMHTRRAAGSIRWLGLNAVGFVLLNRWVSIPWCVTMLTGLYASGRMIVAAGLGPRFLLGHGLLGCFHFMLLAFHVGGHGPPKTRPASK